MVSSLRFVLLIIRCIVVIVILTFAFLFCLLLFSILFIYYYYFLFIYLFLSRVLLCLLHYLSYNLPVEHTKGTEMKKRRGSANNLSLGQRLRDACKAVEITCDDLKEKTVACETL